jgi:hypothetical protein
MTNIRNQVQNAISRWRSPRMRLALVPACIGLYFSFSAVFRISPTKPSPLPSSRFPSSSPPPSLLPRLTVAEARRMKPLVRALTNSLSSLRLDQNSDLISEASGHLASLPSVHENHYAEHRVDVGSRQHLKGGEITDADLEQTTYNGKITFDNGSKYEGAIVNGKPNGFGRYLYWNGDQYEGNYVAGKKEGKGKYTFAGGQRYLYREWKDGKMQWKSWYHGQWKADKQHGYGVRQFANGDKYEGHFVADKPSEGNYTKAGGNEWYDGEWSAVDDSHGYYFQRFDDFNGYFHGSGKYPKFH